VKGALDLETMFRIPPRIRDCGEYFLIANDGESLIYEIGKRLQKAYSVWEEKKQARKNIE
jgi:hypothetical protein